MKGLVCSTCHEPWGGVRRTCCSCHAAYMRGWRKKKPLSLEQKDRYRRRAGVYYRLRTGKMKKELCIKCKKESLMIHGEKILFLCRECLRSHRRMLSKVH